MPNPKPLGTRDRLRLRAETLCADETLTAWITGSRRVLPASAERLASAAQKLGIDVGPPSPPPSRGSP